MSLIFIHGVGATNYMLTSQGQGHHVLGQKWFRQDTNFVDKLYHKI